MKLRLDREDFGAAVAWAARALPARPTSPVLSGIRLAAGGGQLAFQCFDYAVSAEQSIPADGADGDPEVIVTGGRLLAELAKALPAAPVDLSTDGTRATLACGPATFQLPLLPAGEYPQLPDMPAAAGTISGPALLEVYSRVAAGAGQDDTLPALTGVLTHLGPDTVTMTTTDRYRLAHGEAAWTPARPGMDTDLLIPARVLGDVAKAMKADAEVTISLREPGAEGGVLAGFAAGPRKATTRTIEGEYPKYQGLIPASHLSEARVPATALAGAVRLVALVADKGTPVILTFSGDQLVLEAGAEETTARQVMPDDVTWDGEGQFRAAFNPGYLLDGLAQMGGSKARFHFTAEMKPALIDGVNAEDADDPAGFFYLLMPVRSV